MEFSFLHFKFGEVVDKIGTLLKANCMKKNLEVNLTFIDPCIATVFSEFNQQDATFLKFIYFCKTLYVFQTVFPSNIRSSKLHIQCQVFVRLIPGAVCAVLSS